MTTSTRKLAKIKEAGERLPVEFDPARHRLKVAATDYSIEEAKRIKDWPTLEEAVDAKIVEQQNFVGWWDEAVQSAGRKWPSNSPGTRGITCGEAEDLTGMTNQRVADLRKRLDDKDDYRQRLLGASYRAAMLEGADNVRGTGGTGENEWFTPEEYITLARSVLGDIDLDPATHPKAQEIVQAKKFFTKADDGLSHKWHGRVWLNPPYAQPHIANFASKMVSEVKSARVTAAIMLTHNYTDTAWFHELANTAAMICFTRGRIRFYEPNGVVAAPTQGQAFFYFGSEDRKFAAAFASVGFIMRRDGAGHD